MTDTRHDRAIDAFDKIMMSYPFPAMSIGEARINIKMGGGTYNVCIDHPGFRYQAMVDEHENPWYGTRFTVPESSLAGDLDAAEKWLVLYKMFQD